MPQRGPNFFSSELGDRIRKEFKILYSFGYKVEEITEALKSYYGNYFTYQEEWNLFWLILAKLQIMHGVLQEEVKTEALRVINSGDDIKQWEEYVEIEKYKFSYNDYSNKLIHEIIKEQEENPDIDIIEETIKKFRNMQEEVKENTLAKGVPVFVKEYYEKDSYAKIDIFGNDGKKYLKLRVKEIDQLKSEMYSFVPFKKKISKQQPFSPNWQVGDVYAFKISQELDYDDSINKEYYDCYMLFTVTGIKKKPLSKVFPSLAYEEEIFIAQFDYIGKDIPSTPDLENFDYIKRKTSRSVYKGSFLDQIKSNKGSINYYWISFYNSVRKYKQIEFIKVASKGDFKDKINHDQETMMNVWDLVFVGELQRVFFKNLFSDESLN